MTGISQKSVSCKQHASFAFQVTIVSETHDNARLSEEIVSLGRLDDSTTRQPSIGIKARRSEEKKMGIKHGKMSLQLVMRYKTQKADEPWLPGFRSPNPTPRPPQTCRNKQTFSHRKLTSTEQHCFERPQWSFSQCNNSLRYLPGSSRRCPRSQSRDPKWC
ncbi:unnamed protein product [Protopolystoma xenopodis]|uniref:Uncharacterized protein n=1 Tax=Protopolystoma xenopodis TaxID=117903 RepID=A0A448WQZ9_9PLAT|nr:unnamed protein product [Protopolystoma xenopodis]